MTSVSLESVHLDEANLTAAKQKGIRLSVLRLDQIHPVISGNKWFKLKYHLEKARTSGKEQIVTFGGAYSNHIVATAAAGNLLGFRTAGIIRGHRPLHFSESLCKAEDYGMQLFFLESADYQARRLPAKLNDAHPYVIEEAGYSLEGATGAAEILDHCRAQEFSHIACAVGTATTLAGLVKASLPTQEVIGISVLKSTVDLQPGISPLLSPQEQRKQFEINRSYSFGGYAKYQPSLLAFMNEFYRETSIPSDFVYTGKLFYGIVDMIGIGRFPRGSNVLVIHSGGLQGNHSLRQGTLIF